MKKNGQAETALIYIIGILIVAGVIYFGYKQITTVTKAEKELSLEELKARIRADVDKISSQLGASRNFSYILPAQFNQLCFVDLSKKDEITGINPLISDSIEANATANAFLIGNVFEAFNAGNVRVCNPFYVCYNAAQQKIYVEMRGTGAQTIVGPLCPEAINLPPNITSAEPDPNKIIIQKENEFDINLNIIAEDPENSNLKIKWIVNRKDEKTEEIVSGGSSLFSKKILPGIYKIVAVATDNFNLSDYKQWNIGLYPLTGAPFFISYTNISRATIQPLGTDSLPTEFSTRIKEAVFFEVLAKDPENDKITYSAENLPSGALFDPSTRRFLWISKKNDAPTDGGIKTFVVKFKATAKDGIGETTATINVNPNKRPIALFIANPTSGITPLVVSFDASQSNDEDGSVIIYEWDFGDGTKETTTTPTIIHTYTTKGEHSVTLRVKDNDDDYSELETATIIVGAPEIVCEISTICPKIGYNFSTNVIALSSNSNAHGATLSTTLPQYLANKICCSSNVEINADCPGNIILKLSSQENAHASKPEYSDYNVDICLNAPERTASCEYKDNCDQDSGEGCILSISADTNAHLGDCSAYQKKLCCKIT